GLATSSSWFRTGRQGTPRRSFRSPPPGALAMDGDCSRNLEQERSLGEFRPWSRPTRSQRPRVKDVVPAAAAPAAAGVFVPIVLFGVAGPSHAVLFVCC